MESRVVKRAVRMCKRCFKTCVVGGEVLTNGITLCLLVIRSLVGRTLFPRPVSLSLFHRRHGRGPGNNPFLATFSSSRKGSLRRGGVICYLCARNETDFLSSRGGSAESITFISSVSAKAWGRMDNIAGARQGAHSLERAGVTPPRRLGERIVSKSFFISFLISEIIRSPQE